MTTDQNCIIAIVIAFMLFSIQARSQDAAAENAPSETKHRVTLIMANSFIPAADNVDGQNQIYIVPTWGLNYDYWITPKLGAGIHTDFVLQQFKIEKSSDETVIERSFPVIVSGVFLYKVSERLTLLLGAGSELEKHENFAIINAGIEYGFELPNQWELNINLVYDNKLNAYDSWMLGAGFSKWLSPRKRKHSSK